MIAGTGAEYRSDARSTKDTPYLALVAELLGVFCWYFKENWPRYTRTTLYNAARMNEGHFLSKRQTVLWMRDKGVASFQTSLQMTTSCHHDNSRFPLIQTHFTLYMMTSSSGNIFRVTGPLCGEFTGPGEFPTQRPVTRNFDVFFDLRLNKPLSKQSWGWWFETLSCSLWRHRNE